MQLWLSVYWEFCADRIRGFLENGKVKILEHTICVTARYGYSATASFN